MKTIPLSRGKVAIVDDEDYERLLGYSWCAYPSGQNWYAYATSCGVHMHQVVLNSYDGSVDHINGDSLDNRKENLRKATAGQNRANSRKHKATSSRFKGVDRKGQKWRAHIKSEGKTMYLGTFQTEEEAAQAYDEAARRLFGEFARPNFPTPSTSHESATTDTATAEE